MAMNFVNKVTSQPVTWTQYAYHNWLLGILLTFISLFLVILLLKPEHEMEAKDIIAQKYEELGAITRQEKTVLGIMLLLIIALLTGSYHHLDPAWIFILLCAICFLPGFNLINQEKLSKINLGIVLFIAGTMSIGEVGVACGAGKWIADSLIPYLSGSQLYTVMAAWLYAVVINFILTPIAATGAFTTTIAQIATNAGVNPVPVIYSFLQGLDQYLFPYEYAILMYVYGFGYISMKHMVKVLSTRLVVTGIFIALIAYPYWKFIGLF